METKTINLRDMPEELVRRAKACAALRGLSLKDFIIEAVEKALENPGLDVVTSAAFFVTGGTEHRKRRRTRKTK